MSLLYNKLIRENLKTITIDEQEYRIISSSTIDLLINETNIPGIEIEKEALKNNIIPAYYQRNIGTFGIRGQINFLNSCIAIIGAGGLGGHVIDLLARAGTGHIIIIDGDRFEEENLNRQILCTKETVHCNKSDIAGRHVQKINSNLSITSHIKKLCPENAQTMLTGADIVVDCVDHIPTRLVIQEAASTLGIPMVSAAIAGYSGYVTTILPGDKGWKNLVNNSSIPDRGIEVLTGNPPATPAFAASIEMQEAVKLTVKNGDLLQNKLFFFDLESNTFELIQIKTQ